MATALRQASCGPSGRPAGWTALLPGYPQWAWRQGDRGAVFFGTFAAALIVALFGWGSPAGMAMLGLAFAVHVASASDAIRQGAFPGFGRWVPTVSASLGLGLGCYGPALALASVVAWPDRPEGADQASYAINRTAYRHADPRPGEWVWYRSPTGSGFGLGRTVAGGGGSVEWSAAGLRVDGQDLGWAPKARGGEPIDLAMIVPEERLLVAPAPITPGPGSSCGLLLVPRASVVGRAWAQLTPVWNRRLLD